MGTRIAEPSTGAQASGRISFEQFLVDYDGEHVEWVDGEVLPMSPVSNRHVRIHFFLLSLLGRYNEVHSAGEILFEPFCMKIGPDLPARSPDILFVAFGQPKGEFWIAERLEQLGVPVCVQVGATLDFVAGRVKRSPKWMQKTGLEWVYRMMQEPRRLAKRYLDNIVFLVRAVFASRFRKERRAILPSRGA